MTVLISLFLSVVVHLSSVWQKDKHWICKLLVRMVCDRPSLSNSLDGFFGASEGCWKNTLLKMAWNTSGGRYAAKLLYNASRVHVISQCSQRMNVRLEIIGVKCISITFKKTLTEYIFWMNNPHFLLTLAQFRITVNIAIMNIDIGAQFYYGIKIIQYNNNININNAIIK